MPTYIALLRAVNVGGRIYKMAELREHLTDSGLEDVETYIQTGNVRFRSSMRSAAKVEKHVEEVLGEHAAFEVPSVIARIGRVGRNRYRPPSCNARRVRLRDDHVCQFIVNGLASPELRVEIEGIAAS